MYDILSSHKFFGTLIHRALGADDDEGVLKYRFRSMDLTGGLKLLVIRYTTPDSRVRWEISIVQKAYDPEGWDCLARWSTNTNPTLEGRLFWWRVRFGFWWYEDFGMIRSWIEAKIAELEATTEPETETKVRELTI